MSNFAQSLLIEMLGSKMLLEPSQARELWRGIEFALGENFSRQGRSDELPLESLVEALEKMGLPEKTAVVNLLKIPLSPLWVRAELKNQKKRVAGLREGTILVVGLWNAVGGDPRGRRGTRAEAAFLHWRAFVEEQLKDVRCGKLTIIFVG